MIIYFFKARSDERIDFSELIDDYFDKLENTILTHDDEEFQAVFNIPYFDCSYRYLITKRSRVTSFYRLNSNYVNTFLLCEIPEAIPQYVIRLILKQINEMCIKFKFAIYHEKIDNIAEFNMFELIAVMTRERTKYLAEHPEIKTYPVEQDMLNEICTYESIINDIPNIVNDDIVATPYIILKDANNNVYFSVNWQVGRPTTFPPHLDFVHVEEEENLVNLVPIQVFNKFIEKYMYDVKNGSLDIKIKYLSESGSNKARKFIRKMRKSFVSTYNYETIKIIDLIEK